MLTGVNLREAYERSCSDKTLLSLRDAIAVCEARAEELIGQLATGELLSASEPVRGAFAQPTQALREHVEAAAAERRKWAEIMACFEQRRKLTETEAKTVARTYRCLTTEQVVTIMSALVAIITRHVQDRATLAAIAGDICALRV